MEIIANQKIVPIARIGSFAPPFRALSTKGSIYFPSDFGGKWVLFFNRLTDVVYGDVPEYLELIKMENEFRGLNCDLIGFSSGGPTNFNGWINSMRQNMMENGMEIVDIDFPLISDFSSKISKKYGMKWDEGSDLIKAGVVYFIDPDGLIRAKIHFPISPGYNMEELKWLLVALQTNDLSSNCLPFSPVAGNTTDCQATGLFKNMAVKMASQEADLKKCDCFYCAGV